MLRVPTRITAMGARHRGSVSVRAACLVVLCAACFDPRGPGLGTDGGVGDGAVTDGADPGRDAAAPPGMFALSEGILLSGPLADSLTGVAASGDLGPYVAGSYTGGSGSFGTQSIDTDQGPGDFEGVVAAVNSVPLNPLTSILPIPSPTSDGSSQIEAHLVAVDSGRGLLVASGTSRVNEPVVFAPDTLPVTCPGTWIAAWSLVDGESLWRDCYPGALVVERLRIHPDTGRIGLVGSFEGAFDDYTSMGVDGFVASLDTSGDLLHSFIVEGPSDDEVLDLAPYLDGWLAVGHDQRASFGSQALVWMLEEDLSEVGPRLEVGGAARDVATAIVREVDATDHFWVATANDGPSSIADAVLGPAGLIAVTASPSALTATGALQVSADDVEIAALAAMPGAIVFAGAARGRLTVGAAVADGVADHGQPCWGRVVTGTGAVDSLAQLDLAGGEGALFDVEWQADGVYAVGQVRGSLSIGGTTTPVPDDDGLLLRLAATP